MTPRRNAFTAAAALIIVSAAIGFGWFGKPTTDRRSKNVLSTPVPTNRAAAPKDSAPTLYCEFTNFSDRTPLVGFYFLIEEARTPPRYALIFQREQDGSEANFEGETALRREWTFDGSDSPAVIRAPDDTMTINLYDYAPSKPGLSWFEAGLRSVRYRNLGGRCRRSAA